MLFKYKLLGRPYRDESSGDSGSAANTVNARGGYGGGETSGGGDYSGWSSSSSSSAAAQEAARIAAEQEAARQAAAAESARLAEVARVEAERKETERLAAVDRANREQQVEVDQAQTRSILSPVAVSGFATPTSINADSPDVNKIGPAANIANTNLASVNSSITKATDDSQPSKDPESLVNRVGIIGDAVSGDKAEKKSPDAMSAMDKVMAWLSFVPGAQAITAPYGLVRLAQKTYDDATNPNVTAGQTVANLAKGVIIPQALGVANGIIGNAVGKDGAQLLSSYSQAAKLSNLLGDGKDQLPTSPASYLLSKATSGPTYTDGLQHAANGDVINVGGFSSSTSSGNRQATAAPVAVAATTPTPPPTELPNGIIGNYLQWFNQGRGTLKQKGA